MTYRQTIASLKRQRKMMLLFTGFLFLFALAIALMPLGSSMKEKTILITYCSGAGFWIGLIGTSFMVLIINQSCKASVRFNELYGDKKQFGIIHFFQNMEAKIMDVLMFVSLFTIIIAKVCNAELQLIYIIFAVFVFSFGMHCMLNGLNYKYINYSKYVKEQKKDE